MYAAMRAAELAEVWCGYRGRASWRLQWVLIMAVHIDYGRAHVVTPPSRVVTSVMHTSVSVPRMYFVPLY